MLTITEKPPTQTRVKSQQRASSLPVEIVQTEPYAHYCNLRQQGNEIIWDEQAQKWLVLSYRLVREAARDERLASHSTGIEPDGAESFFSNLPASLNLSEIERAKLARLYQMLSRQLILVSDKSDHSRLRGLMSKTFTPKAVEAMHLEVQALADSLIDRLIELPRPDLVKDLAEPLPMLVICRILGLPTVTTADLANFKRWSKALASLLTINTETNRKLTSLREIATSITELTEYIQHTLEKMETASIEGQTQPGLLGVLAQAWREGIISQDELIANMLMMIAAGQETMVHLIGNCFYSLMQHPDQLELLRQQPELVPQAIEECLRYESPLKFVKRLATCDFELGGKWIRRGERVLLMLGAANRDEAQFHEPDKFDILRPAGPSGNNGAAYHLAFGHNMHFCIGKFLALMQAQIALETLLRKTSKLKLGAEPNAIHWRNDPAFRGLDALPVSLNPAWPCRNQPIRAYSHHAYAPGENEECS